MAFNKQTKLIIDAIEECYLKNIKIIRGATFHWKSDSELFGTNDYGALLLKLNLRLGTKTPTMKRICEHLGVGEYWMYKFSIGFNYVPMINMEQKKDNTWFAIGIDPIAELGRRISNQYVNG